MAFCNELISNRILEVLTHPVPERCAELNMLLEQCTLRELQDVFPSIVSSIFGVGSGDLGWGLRVTPGENAPYCYNMIREFFSPLGAMLRMCYRLLNEAIKFEFDLELLPRKAAEMIRSGQYSMFYSDLVNVDPFRRQVTSLTLNAFDFYMLHFVVHGTKPLQNMYPAALQVHNERSKTLYFFLTCEYLFTFLPGNPDDVVLPTNICSTVKAPQPMPVQPLQPTRSPKYLKLPNLNMYAGGNSPGAAAATQVVCNAESPRSQAWRTESVLHFFIDIWLRYNIDEARDLPSSEFIRVVRLLVKHVHTFANAAPFDQTAMVTLRKIAQPLMRARFYPFIKSIISRWPLDSSLLVVEELWLSYIQPWRYTWTHLKDCSNVAIEIPPDNRFDNFIAENVVIYTQIFVHILLRFERMDFTSARNVALLSRLVRVFSQPTLMQRLYQAEQTYLGNNFAFNTPQKHSSYMGHNTTIGTCEWDSFVEEDYTPLFGPEVRAEVKQFIRTIAISRAYVKQEIGSIQWAIMQRKKDVSLFRSILARFLSDHSPEEEKLREINKMPETLQMVINSLCRMFDIEHPDIPCEQIDPRPLNHTQISSSSTVSSSKSNRSNKDELDMSKINPMTMKYNLSNIKSTIDPALLPIQSNECKFLVRMLHQVSCKINEMYSEEIQQYYNRTDFCGKLARKILLPPMTAQWFDKPRGINELFEEQLPPRLCLRMFGSYSFLISVGLSLLLGRWIWGSSILGLMMALLFSVVFLLILTLFS